MDGSLEEILEWLESLKEAAATSSRKNKKLYIEQIQQRINTLKDDK